jgi:Acetyltransferase (GNAT) family.
MEVNIDQIRETELDCFLDILRSIANWLASNGNDMWSLEGLQREAFLEANPGAELYICKHGSDPIGAFMLKGENRFWWPEIDGDDTFFLKKFGISEGYRGTGASARVMDQIKDLAKERNKKFIRIEFYGDRAYLRKFYEANGLEFVRQRVMPDGIEILFYEYRIV